MTPPDHPRTPRPAAAGGPPTIWHRLDLVLARIRPHREPLSLLADALVIAFCWNVTYLFRLGFERWIEARPSYDPWVMLGVVGAYLAAFAALRVPQAMWRFSGFGEVKRLTLACVLAGSVSAAVVMGLGLVKVPRAVLALHPFVALMGVCVVRVAYRMLYEHARQRITGSEREIRRAVVMGAGAAARLLLAGIHEQGWIVLGLLDDDPAKHGARIAGVPVLGPLDAITDKAVRGAATHVVVALPSATRAQRRRALDLAAATGLPVVTVPGVDELRTGQSRIERLREIEPEDLLGREPVRLDDSGVAAVIAGRTVLITGAGGSIGSELCRQVARFAPARIVLYELSEFNLYTIEQELSLAFPNVALVRLIGDVKDLAHLRAACAAWRPDIVFHAAAFKHVPLMEEEHNALAALRNNTLGTYHAALAAAEAGCGRFVLISTDKAVNPTNVMGATKRAAEMVVSMMAARHPGTRFMAVRFGNVLGSSGSVIPKFKEQIARGGPVTVTHPDIIRYFMTIPEAARLVLQAAAVGESGQVLVLDMGEPVKIVDLARDLIRLAGQTQDIRIEFTGLRPGEKLYEELLADADDTLPTAVPRLRIARLAAESGEIGALLHWAAAAQGARDIDVREMLRQVVAEYRPAA
ncbi:polysaccharide biosynthesis protein [Rubrivivax gelatinosus]|uniref:FlaA1/EpsC-like NDP-sugar epimerase n=1 Tax=Rubrivivax gelatinosus TaxID=28068 RepID=A0A4R2M861_RUBGE|nr:nucleoside-diphosphate sugar epimerase/dehydratase [Rubrivivax gelatinosus]MBK1688147.1 polysaccharide biosynthesis protein [Rubrivivax gelatinosus]TCP02510.1 FlaA1/EpsC-like NDP-sugar epimerase [Rubrivivax gelatinosus]